MGFVGVDDESVEVKGDGNADVDADATGEDDTRGGEDALDDVISVVRFADERPKVDSRRKAFLNGMVKNVRQVERASKRKSKREERRKGAKFEKLLTAQRIRVI